MFNAGHKRILQELFNSVNQDNKLQKSTDFICGSLLRELYACGDCTVAEILNYWNERVREKQELMSI